MEFVKLFKIKIHSLIAGVWQTTLTLLKESRISPFFLTIKLYITSFNTRLPTVSPYGSVFGISITLNTPWSTYFLCISINASSTGM